MGQMAGTYIPAISFAAGDLIAPLHEQLKAMEHYLLGFGKTAKCLDQTYVLCEFSSCRIVMS